MSTYRIKEILAQKGMKQKELAEKLHMSAQQLSRIINRDALNDDKQNRVAKALGVRRCELLGDFAEVEERLKHNMAKEEMMELRYKYAGMAMRGILSNQDMAHSAIEAAEQLNMSTQQVVARNAISYADALIEELTNETED